MQEDPKRTLYFAHIFFVDHLVSTTWTVFFGVLWWVYNPHDGKRQANSKAQQDLMALAGNVTIPLTDDERAEAAMRIWNKEKGFAMTLLVVGWLAKVRRVRPRAHPLTAAAAAADLLRAADILVRGAPPQGDVPLAAAHHLRRPATARPARPVGEHGRQRAAA